MKSFVIDFTRTNRNGEEHLIRMEFDREGITSREFREYIVSTLFELAAEGIKNKYLNACVVCEGKKAFTVRANTHVDGSTINCVLFVARPREKFTHYRTMNIAS